METTSTAMEVERLERKVDMSLDEIIKIQKKSERKAKKSTIKPLKNTRKNASQGSVASRSSAIRQGKLAQSRPPHGTSNLLTAKRAGFKALHSNDTFKMKRRNRKRTRNTTRPSGGATSNIRVLVPNDISRLSTGRRRGGAAARLNRAPDEFVGQLEINDPERNVQTLDSRFASLRGARQVPFSGRHGF